MPILTAARSKTCVCGRSLAGTEGSNPVGGMDVLCDCCELSVRGRCIGRSPTECGVSECERETSKMKKSWPNSGCCTMKKNPRVTLSLGKPKVAQKGRKFPTTFLEGASSLWRLVGPWTRRTHSTFSIPVPLKLISALSSYLQSNCNKWWQSSRKNTKIVIDQTSTHWDTQSAARVGNICWTEYCNQIEITHKNQSTPSENFGVGGGDMSVHDTCCNIFLKLLFITVVTICVRAA